MAKPGPKCPYCPENPPSVLRDAGDVYGPTYTGKFNMWCCVNYPDCDAYVGVHKNSYDAAPLGTLANGALRKLRRQCHARFDPLFAGGAMSRRKAYEKLAKIMGMPVGRAHIGEFNEEQCQALLAHLYGERAPALQFEPREN